jgi:hypothetical protein
LNENIILLDLPYVLLAKLDSRKFTSCLRVPPCIMKVSSLADNEEWLANNFDKMVQVPAGAQPGHITLVAEEERVLRCLGAAVIMQWNTLPAKLQRELFDTAGSMGDLLDTAALRGQIARFLHKHKDDESEA